MNSIIIAGAEMDGLPVHEECLQQLRLHTLEKDLLCYRRPTRLRRIPRKADSHNNLATASRHQ
jgi:hypothetical protein